MLTSNSMRSIAEAYSQLNENIDSDSRAHKLSRAANDASAFAHAGQDHADAHQAATAAHHAAADHYAVYSRHSKDPVVKHAADIHQKFHNDMAQHHMLRAVHFSMKEDAEYTKASENDAEDDTIEDFETDDAADDNDENENENNADEGPGAAKAGPEVTGGEGEKAFKAGHDSNVKVEDAPYTNKADGSENIIPADKPEPKQTTSEAVNTIKTVADAYRSMRTAS